MTPNHVITQRHCAITVSDILKLGVLEVRTGFNKINKKTTSRYSLSITIAGIPHFVEIVHVDFQFIVSLFIRQSSIRILNIFYLPTVPNYASLKMNG